MIKTLKFVTHLIKPILDGTKTTTWRFFDDKDLMTGDTVDFLESGTNKKFATVRLTNVYTKPLGELTEEDIMGHETYSSDEEMYKEFSQFYGKEVGPETEVKIIQFKHV